MVFKYPLIVLLFLLLLLIQFAFLPRLAIMGAAPNLVFVLFFVLVFFEKPYAYVWGIFFTVLVGFGLDIFFSLYFGPFIISLLLAYGVVKIYKHFFGEKRGNFLFIYFAALFLLCLGLFEAVSYGIGNFSVAPLRVNQYFFMSVFLNVVSASVGFFLYPFKASRQL